MNDKTPAGGQRHMDTRRGAIRTSSPLAVYSSAVAYLLANGWRRQELGSGWWWKDGCEEEATLGGALEQQLDADGVDQRDAIADEPTEFWG